MKLVKIGLFELNGNGTGIAFSRNQEIDAHAITDIHRTTYDNIWYLRFKGDQTGPALYTTTANVIRIFEAVAP